MLQVCNATPTNVISQYDTISFAYHNDDIGNRESSSERGSNSVYTANSLNQYTAVDDFTPQFDDDGNQTLVKTATGIWSVTYNGENRPVLWTLVNFSTVNSITPLRKQVLRRLFSGLYPRASPHAEKRNWKIPLTPAGRGRVRKLGIRWWFSGLYPRASRTRRMRNWKIPFTPAGRGRVRKLGIRWWFSGSYPRASPHAEKEEF